MITEKSSDTRWIPSRDELSELFPTSPSVDLITRGAGIVFVDSTGVQLEHRPYHELQLFTYGSPEKKILIGKTGAARRIVQVVSTNAETKVIESPPFSTIEFSADLNNRLLIKNTAGYNLLADDLQPSHYTPYAQIEFDSETGRYWGLNHGKRELILDTPEDTKSKLEEYHINTQLWGHGQAKTIAQLWQELRTGESILDESDGILKRKTYVGGLKIYCQVDGNWFVLREMKQVLKRGGERIRDHIDSLTEKMKPDENPYDTYRRGAEEELSELTRKYGSTWVMKLTFGPVSEKITKKDSRSYPGLNTIFTIYSCSTVLPQQYYHPEGYKEEQVDKTTYFEWEKCNPQMSLDTTSSDQDTKIVTDDGMNLLSRLKEIWQG